MDITENDLVNIVGALEFGAKHMLDDAVSSVDVSDELERYIKAVEEDCAALARSLDSALNESKKTKNTLIFEKLTSRHMATIAAACSFAKTCAGDFDFYHDDNDNPVPLSVVQRFQRECADIEKRFLTYLGITRQPSQETLH